MLDDNDNVDVIINDKVDDRQSHLPEIFSSNVSNSKILSETIQRIDPTKSGQTSLDTIVEKIAIESGQTSQDETDEKK